MFTLTSLISAVMCIGMWFSHCHFTELLCTVEFILFACSLGGGLVPTVDYIYGYLASTRFPIAGNWRVTKMALCLNCTSQTNYICLSCKKSAECSVPADEETPRWKLGVSVAFCLQCSKRKQGSDILGGQGSTKKLLDGETKFPAVSCNAKVPLTLSKEQLQAESA